MFDRVLNSFLEKYELLLFALFSYVFVFVVFLSREVIGVSARDCYILDMIIVIITGVRLEIVAKLVCMTVMQIQYVLYWLTGNIIVA